ncbi:hypothetical protein CGRA01v4_02364 [Colletotrichum graminicola]|nr:hypothetical protein CGRA01v4_02364 [Colletotrichum graminicola]
MLSQVSGRLEAAGASLDEEGRGWRRSRLFALASWPWCWRMPACSASGLPAQFARSSDIGNRNGWLCSLYQQ